MRTAVLIVCLAAAVAIFFADVLFEGRVLLTANPAAFQPWRSHATEDQLSGKNYRTDSILTYLPRRAELSTSVASGRFPLWNPYILLGVPFFADPQSRVLYPVSLLLAPADPNKAMGYDVAIHFFIALLGMYLFLRIISGSTAGSILGAATYGFSSFFATRMGHPTFVASAAWIPFLFYGFELARRKETLGTLLLAVFLVMGYLAGFPQIFAFGVGALVIYAIVVSLAGDRGDVSARARGFASTRIIATSGVISLLAVGVHLVPFWEYLRNSLGVGIPLAEMLALHVARPALLLRLAVPGLFGNPIDGTNWLPLVQQGIHPYNAGFMVFCGTSTLVIAAGGLALLGRSAHLRAFAILLAASVALGASGLVFKAAYWAVPLLRYSQIDRVSVLACFALAAMAGKTISVVAETEGARQRRAFLAAAGVAAGAVTVFVLLLFLKGEALLSALAGGAPRDLAANLPQVGAERIRTWLAGGSGWLGYEQKQALPALVFGLGGFALLLALTRFREARIRREVLTAVLVAWAAVDVGLAARSYYVSEAAPGIYSTDGIRWLERAGGARGEWRLSGLDPGSPVLPANTNQIFGLESMEGRSTIMPRSYAYLLGSAHGLGALFGGRADMGVAPTSDLAGLASTRFLLSENVSPSLGLSPTMRAIAGRSDLVRNVRVLDDDPTRPAFCLAAGESAAVDIFVPRAARLEFDFGRAGGAGETPVEFDLRCRSVSGLAGFKGRTDSLPGGGAWRAGSLDLASLGEGPAELVFSVKPGPGRSSAGLRGLDMVLRDCPFTASARGWTIDLGPGGGGALSMEMRSAAREVPLDIRWESHSRLCRLYFGAPPARRLTVALEAPGGTALTVTSDSAFALSSSKVVYDPDARYEAFDLVYSGDMHVYENTSVLPKTMCIDKAAASMQTRGDVPVLGIARLAATISDFRVGDAQIVSYAPERVEITATPAKDCYLLLGDAHYPGWKVSVDGKPAPLVLTDIGTRAVGLVAGPHMIVMQFRPATLRVGLVLSCLGVLLGVLFAARTRFARHA